MIMFINYADGKESKNGFITNLFIVRKAASKSTTYATHGSVPTYLHYTPFLKNSTVRSVDTMFLRINSNFSKPECLYLMMM